MRTLSATLEAAQQASSLDVRLQVTLDVGGDDDQYALSRIIRITEDKQLYSHSATIILDNSDKALDAKDWKGKRCDIEWGLYTLDPSAEYSKEAPLWVLSQNFLSSPGRLRCIIKCVGREYLMAEDRAKENYLPDTSDTDTVSDLVSAIAGATLAPFTDCPAITIDVDSSDSLYTDYQPKDTFRIYKNGSRLAALRRLLDYTKCMMRMENDGKLHIFQPTVSGDSYDYEYELAGDHTIYNKAYRQTLVVPNKIVVSSQDDDDPAYTGNATDATSYARMPQIQYEVMRLASNDEAGDIAAAILSKYQLNAQAGSARVPINVGQEIMDYIQVTDSRAGDARTGNIGRIHRVWDSHIDEGGNSEYYMSFSFGGWLSVRQLLNNLQLHPSGVGGSQGMYFERMQVKDLYVENLLADNIDLVWVDPDGNIDLTLIGDTIDNLDDGATYGRVKSVHLDAGQIKLDATVYYASDYNPTDKFDMGDDTLDDLPEGTTYQRVLSTQISAGKIELTSTGFLVSEDYVKADSSNIVLSGSSMRMDDAYISIYESSTLAAILGAFGGNIRFLTYNSYPLWLESNADIELNPDGDDVYPGAISNDLGTASYFWDDVNYQDLIERSPSPRKIEGALGKLKSMGTHQTRKHIKGVGDVDVETFDRDTMPSELIRPVNQRDRDKAQEVYREHQRRVAAHPLEIAKKKEQARKLEALGKSNLKKRGLDKELSKVKELITAMEQRPPKAAVYHEPQPGISMNAQMGLLYSALREALDRIETLEARL